MEARTKKNLLIWGIGLLVLLNVSSLVTIWYHRYQYTHAHGSEEVYKRHRQQREVMQQNRNGHIHFLSKDLNLSGPQQQVFDSIWHHYAGKRLVLERQLEEKRQQMSALLSQDKPDTVAFHELSSAQADIMRALNNSMLAMNLALRQNLSPRQMKTFLQKIEFLNRRYGRQSGRLHPRQKNR